MAMSPSLQTQCQCPAPSYVQHKELNKKARTIPLLSSNSPFNKLDAIYIRISRKKKARKDNTEKQYK